jgi:hypothetical protein
MEAVKQITIPAMTEAEVIFGTTFGLPEHSLIPEEFVKSQTKWNRLFNDMFFCGLASLQLVPHEGVDTVKAQRHIKALMKSFDPRHGRKEAGVAYLMSQYFEDAEWERAQ